MRAVAILILGLTVAGSASAQKGKTRCTGEPADSALLALGPVYRDCEVSRPAELRTSDFPVDFSPPSSGSVAGACYRAGFQFVVDTVGRPELGTVRAMAGNDRALEDALRPGLSQLRYEPARLGGLRVRQIVIYSRAVEPIVRVSPTDGEAIGLPSARSPTGRCR